MDNELYEHKMTDKVKWIITAAMLLLITIVLVGVCVKVFWQEPRVDDEQLPDNETHVLLSSARIEPETYAENGIDPRAVTAYTITATVQPDSADNKAVSWSIAWQNPNSGWASGKNISDYITLSSTTANPLTVTCKQAFGAQAIVTCTSQDNSELTASCTVDYKQKLSGIVPTVQINGTSYSLNQSTPTLPIASNAKFNIDVNKTVGSISDEFTVSTTVRFSDECIEWLESNFDRWSTGYNKQMTISSDGTFSIDYLLSESNPDCLFVPDRSGGIYGSSAAGMFFYQYLLPDFNNQTFPKLLFTVTVTDSSGNESRYEYKACLERLTVAAVSLSLNNTGIIF